MVNIDNFNVVAEAVDNIPGSWEFWAFKRYDSINVQAVFDIINRPDLLNSGQELISLGNGLFPDQRHFFAKTFQISSKGQLCTQGVAIGIDMRND